MTKFADFEVVVAVGGKVLEFLGIVSLALFLLLLAFLQVLSVLSQSLTFASQLGATLLHAALGVEQGVGTGELAVLDVCGHAAPKVIHRFEVEGGVALRHFGDEFFILILRLL